MKNINSAKVINIIGGTCVVTFFIYGIVYPIINDRELEKHHCYTIGTFTDFKSTSRGLNIVISFNYKGKRYKKEKYNDNNRFTKEDIGNRYLIMITSTNPDGTIDFFDGKYPIPDSIKEAPTEGWAEIPDEIK